MNKQFFAYIRISDPKQGAGVSLEAQKDAIERYAAQNDLIITRWFEERETAAKRGRAEFTSIVEQLQSGAAQGLIMHKIDRSARNLSDWAKIGELQDSGVDVHFAADSVDFASNSGRLTADIHAVMAAHYIRNLREEALKGLNGRLKQGLYPFKAPIGYLDTGKGNAKSICPDRGAKVRKLFKLYATGEHSLLSLVDVAQCIGLKSSKGGKVTKTCIERMLKNPFYIGLMYVWSRKETYNGIHEPLISTELYEQVQEVRRGKSVKKVTKHDYTYRRMFHCRRCARTYSAERQKGLVYYRCHTKGCTQGGLREESLDAEISKALKGLMITGENVLALNQLVTTWTDGVLKTESCPSNSIELGRIKRQQEKLLDALLDGLIDKPTFETRKAQLQFSEQAIVEKQSITLSKEEIATHAADLFELLKNLYFTYSMANSAEKRQMLKILFSNREIDGKNIELEPKNWTRKATNLVTDLLGAHIEDSIRRSQELQFLEIEDAKSIFMSQEWKQLVVLHKEIHDRDRTGCLPDLETSTAA